MQPEPSARDRLLLAAAQLLEDGDPEFSTRAVCDRAGVKAPTLYHHFGSKQGLVDAVIRYGFDQYAGSVSDSTASPDLLADLRRGWDEHVAYGLAHPAFYAMLHGRVRPGQPCGVTTPATEMLTARLTGLARAGLLRMPPADAAAQILAANVGVTLSLIAQPEELRDPTLSERVREAALAGVLAAEPEPAGTGSHHAAAVALGATLAEDPPDNLTPGELLLLRELLDRIGRDSGQGRLPGTVLMQHRH